MTKEYRESRLPFVPKPGEVYENEGGGTYRCLSVDGYTGSARMSNTASGWTFDAYHIGIYSDRKIDWWYSTNGQFL